MPFSPPSFAPRALRATIRDHFPWPRWDTHIERKGLTIDRPFGTAHPNYPSVVYPLDYGFIPGTVGSDGEPIDAFVGTAAQGLVGLILTSDYRQGDREVKLLVDCTPPEIYVAHGFINYDRSLLEGVLVLRRPMPTLWENVEG